MGRFPGEEGPRYSTPSRLHSSSIPLFLLQAASSAIDPEMMTPIGSPTTGSGGYALMGGGISTAITGTSSGLAKLSMGGGGGGASGMGGLCQTIEASELTLQKIIGSGAYGKVRAGWGRSDAAYKQRLRGKEK